MAHARRSPQHRAPSSSISSPSTIRRNSLRRATATSRSSSHASSLSVSSPVHQTHRPVLVPLQANLRRLPSRTHLAQKDKEFNQLMRDSSHVIQVGTKRKRVVSSNENAHTHGRPTRGSGRLKRLRSNVTTTYNNSSTSEDSQPEASEMDIDTPTHASGSDSSEAGEDQEEEAEDGEEQNEEDDSTDDHLINGASRNQLNKIRKSDLLRLYDLAGLSENTASLNKAQLIDAIINARDDFATLPPSSPPRGDGGSSDYSSDDGNVAGGEETDFAGPGRGLPGSPLRRRVTLHDMVKPSTRPLKGRSLSMGHLLGNGQPNTALLPKRKTSARVEIDCKEPTTSKRRSSTRSSPTTSATTSTITQSPPATRTRSRKASTSIPNPSTPTSSSKGKAKAKQVEFSNAVEVHLRTPPKKNSKAREQSSRVDSESDLTELEELEKTLKGQPSPRRLRSKDRELEKSKGKEKEDLDATPLANPKRRKHSKNMESEERAESNEDGSHNHTRVTPTRKAKFKIGSLKELDTDEDLEEEEVDQLQDDEVVEDEEDEDGEEQDEDEVDELVSSASVTPPESRRTPLRRRLRPRRTGKKTTYTGDDENEGDDEDEEEPGADEQEEEEGDREEEEEELAEDDEDDEATIAVEPRKLRNGKIVGEEDIGEEDVEEEDVEMEIDEEDIGEDDEDDEEAEEGTEDGEEAEEDEGVDVEDIDIDAEGETDEDDAMEDDVDLTVATAKTLIRMKRDDLIRLCETRDLEPVGTKPQLAEALLQWRDRQVNDFSSPSSGGTVRPSSTRRRRRTKHHSDSTNTAVPVLLRSGTQVHTDEPRTPVPAKEGGKENEELELDLESLGLEDREIPPEKLTKLEKIGSGGFKDVFIGKFKGRRIAISEFRGQLSAMDIKELKLLGAFNHPNIVRFLGVSIPENTKEVPVMIVSELCSNGDLFDYIRNVHAPSMRKILQMMLDIANGLEYLHTRKPSIIHRDCKSSNILITAKGTAKIADFGLAKVKQSTRSMVKSLVGTVNWQAPELWTAHPKYNHKVDVFSCAMVYWEMLQWHLPNKKFPWESMNEHAIYDIVGAKRQRPSIAGLRKQWSPGIVDLIEHMWAHEHQDRPTMSEVVEAVQDLLSQH
ncbi:hypothetical protein B0H34DRAFT_328730 [Crassisporium funariophilum]|nr:hypothetical protein B0H34DRAFT_328730 [Crassisporium funariophilum]